MTYLFENYKRAPIEFVKAEGTYLIDSEGKAYLDFSSGIGVTNLGFHLDHLLSREPFFCGEQLSWLVWLWWLFFLCSHVFTTCCE